MARKISLWIGTSTAAIFFLLIAISKFSTFQISHFTPIARYVHIEMEGQSQTNEPKSSSTEILWHSFYHDTSRPSERRLLVSPLSTIKPNTTHKPHCVHKINNVAFLKVHKAGSTTVMNIMLRFADENNLNVVLPNRTTGGGFNYLGYGSTVNPKILVPIPYGESYNILCNHVVYNREAFQEILPKDTVYIGIIREPTSQFLSAAFYYGFYKALLSAMPNLISHHPSEVFHQYFTNLTKYQHINQYFVRNRMSFDFGLPREKFNDQAYVSNFLEQIQTDFKLVMVMERFTESLVLMKRYLCWDIEDILYVPLNINKAKNKSPVNLFPVDKKSLREYNSADFALYEKFLDIFEKQVNSEDDSFKAEVTYFSKLQTKIALFCQKPSQHLKMDLLIERSTWNKEFKIKASDCHRMLVSEVNFLTMMIEKARQKYNTWFKKTQS